MHYLDVPGLSKSGAEHLAGFRNLTFFSDPGFENKISEWCVRIGTCYQPAVVETNSCSQSADYRARWYDN